MRFQFIATHALEFRVTTMCRVLQVSKAGYYAWQNLASSRRARSNHELVRTIRTLYTQSRGTYGSPGGTAGSGDATWTTRATAQQALFEYIEVWYNRHRRHSSLGYRSPVEYERTQLDRAA